MTIAPDWHHDFRVPTVADDVVIHGDDVVTLHHEDDRQRSFRLSVQPRSVTGKLSLQAEALAALIQATHDATAEYIDESLKPTRGPADRPDRRVLLKNILENHRSILEYAAHHLAEYCDPRPPEHRVQFPIARASDTREQFQGKLTQWFPGLAERASRVVEHLMSIQPFSGERWLLDLADVTNYNKHRSLSRQETAEFSSVLIHFGGTGVRLGELGFRSVNLTERGVLRLAPDSSTSADIMAPESLDQHTTRLRSKDSRIVVTTEKRELIRIPDHTESIPHLLWVIAKNVLRTVDRICVLLSVDSDSDRVGPSAE